ncbi:TcpE family conjugal transfer membrane protein [Streptococcus oriscaviae]|uniref:Conjugal transfer protein n=1 Tax=Streptococcus oriscaviae TaxID=2781599 RepID=A0ABX7YID0_9STRE|nr:TcpE family conjugal transfer membrane protein [Streptococcus oriscaviae]QUE53551.1 conjugal transfer protein [Streptococcus oriscaviae]
MKDKKLFSYKEALEQPHWIRSIAKIYTFSSAVKFSRFVYFTILALVFFLLIRMMRFIPLNYNIMLTVFSSWVVAGILEDLKVDGRPFAFYFKDYLVYYFTYGRKERQIYINKGKVYQRHDLEGEDN